METTPAGVSQPPVAHDLEDKFQSLFDSGALDTQAKQADNVPAAPLVEGDTSPAAEPEAEAEDDTPEYASLEDYLAKAKMDPASFHSLPVTVKVDGKTELVPLADVIKSFQLEKHVNNKSIELSTAQKTFETERQAAIDLYRTQLTQAKALGDLAQNQLMGEFNQINWMQLRQSDPAQWAALQQEFNNRAAAINQHLSQVATAQAAQEQERQQAQARLLPQEREKMLEARPEWRDTAKFDADKATMTKYAKQLGYSDAELAQIYDHRQMQVLHDAARFRALQASEDPALKRVRAAPQMGKPGTRTDRDPKMIAKKQAIERFNKNPRDQDAQAAAFEALLN